MKTSHWNNIIAYLNFITEIVDIIIKHLFLTVTTPPRLEHLKLSILVQLFASLLLLIKRVNTISVYHVSK